MKKLLALGLLGLVLASCGKKEETTTGPKETTIFAMHLGKALDPNLPVFVKAEKDTNIKLVNVASQNQTDQIQAYNLMLTEGKLPDIVSYELSADLENLGIEGGLIPLEDLINQHAPNLKKFFEENPRYKKDAVAVDGHIYMIPNYYDYFNIKVSQGYFIRQDWLEKLGLKEPRTIDELYTTLKAFREKDPNGNGKKDEVPFFVRANNVRKVLTSLVDLFKASPIWYEENGMVKYGPAQKEFKHAIKELSKWYKEGLIDEEIFTRGLESRDYLLSNNLGGATDDWIASTSSYNRNLADKIPGFNLKLVLPYELNGNAKTRHARTTYLGGWGISKDAKDPVSLIKYFDYWYSVEGRRLWNFGIEGSEYTLVDGKPVFTDKVLKNPDGKTPLAVLREVGAQYRLGAFQDAQYELGWASESAKAGYKYYMDNDVVLDELPILKYTKEKSKEFVSIDTAIRAVVEEKAQQWILGSGDIDKEWDAYIKRLENLGLSKAEQIQNEAFKNFNK
ncbi:extracellular solute-binding protein [Streptobacillus moniliformis]|uniref:extracellular solute-binding protein n=1 Tax=Streptobacillus moniliformis TaxID=34105 RepID=UPI0007E433DA|nr:extracellular solute-binding protein [Streptobacillus moniliformis]